MHSPLEPDDAGSGGAGRVHGCSPARGWVTLGCVAGRLLGGGNLHAVKKLILALVAAGAGVAMWRKRSSSKPQQQLWAQATDRV